MIELEATLYTEDDKPTSYIVDHDEHQLLITILDEKSHLVINKEDLKKILEIFN